MTWDVENRPTIVGTETYVYDGDGNRISKTVGGVTTLYINKYYEKNTGTGTVTTSYYLGDKLVATREGTTLTYIHQDSLNSTSVVSDSSGAAISSIKYYPFGGTRSGSVSNEKKFTGQRLDGTGLYYYGARYYDPTIGRFISADTVVQLSTGSDQVSTFLTVNYISLANRSMSSPMNAQSLNRYSYALNNPLRYVDPIGHSNISSDDGYNLTPTYTIVWGYVDVISFFVSYTHSVIVVVDNSGNYYRLETWGGGVETGGVYASWVYIPGTVFSTNNITDENTWDFGIGGSVGIISGQSSGSAGVNSNPGFYFDDGHDKVGVLYFEAPEINVTISKTNVTSVSNDEIYSDVPSWVKNIYDSWWGIDLDPEE